LPPSPGPSGLVLALFGPTASGKTAVAEAIASRIPADLVSADSMQLYRGLPILTNQGAGRLVGIWPLDRQGSVGEFRQLAHTEIDTIMGQGRTPVVVGGSGLYFQAALTDFELPPPVTESERASWAELYEQRGPEHVHELLRTRDPRAAAQVHPNDRKRVIRALELAAAGTTLVPETSRLWTEETRHPTVVFGLDVPADILEARIRRRAEEMFARGVADEVRAAGEVVPRILGFDAVRTLPPEEAIEEIVHSTRRLSAYQRKWLRRIPGIVTIDANRSAEEVADAILEVARARQ
jgi:tRNA dimethylallyltransferase